MPRKGLRYSVVLLLSGPRIAGVVQDVFGPDREDAEAADLVHYHLPGRHGRHNAERRGRKSTARDGGVFAYKSPARLSGMRPRRRMRAAGSHIRLGRRRRTFYGKEKRGTGEISFAD